MDAAEASGREAGHKATGQTNPKEEEVTWTWVDVLLISITSIIWVYIAARMITRAVFRTIDERNDNGKA